MRIAVIGAGWAACTAAVDLARRGHEVSVFEAAAVPGGRARRVVRSGLPLDNGQHLLLGCYRETLRLIGLVGGDAERDFLRLLLQLDLHGHFALKAPRLPAPLHLLV